MQIVAVHETHELLTKDLGKYDVVFATTPAITPEVVAEANRIVATRGENIDLRIVSGQLILPGANVQGGLLEVEQFGKTRAERLQRLLTQAEATVAEKKKLEEQSQDSRRKGVAHWFGVPVKSKVELAVDRIVGEHGLNSILPQTDEETASLKAALNNPS